MSGHLEADTTLITAAPGARSRAEGSHRRQATPGAARRHRGGSRHKKQRQAVDERNTTHNHAALKKHDITATEGIKQSTSVNQVNNEGGT